MNGTIYLQAYPDNVKLLRDHIIIVKRSTVALIYVNNEGCVEANTEKYVLLYCCDNTRLHSEHISETATRRENECPYSLSLSWRT
jgi:hypothetical protein